MAITETSPEFKTSDGRKFKDKAVAERHEELITAQEEYESARRKFCMALARTQVTADGKPFDFGLWANYLYISKSWGERPCLKEVEFWGRDFDFDHRDEFVITKRDQRSGSKQEFRIGELYLDKAVAEKALLVALDEWLAEQIKNVEKTRQRVSA